MQRFKSLGSTQRFLSVHTAVYNTYYHQRHLLNRQTFKQLRAQSLGSWSAATDAVWKPRCQW
jgi:putative transposase